MDINNDPDINDLPEKILAGVQKAVRQLIEANAIKNESMVIGDVDGNISTVPARELLEKLNNQAK